MTVPHPNDPNQNLVIRIQYIKKKEMNDCVQFYNVMLNNIQKILGLVEMSRNYYDSRAIHDIPKHK